MADKNIYDLLNETDNNIDGFEEQDLTEMEKERMKKYVRENGTSKSTKKGLKVNKWKTYKYLAASAAVFMVTVGSVSVVSATSLENETAYKIASFLGINKNLDAYETVVDQAVTKENITIALKEVVFNQDELLVSVISSSQDYNVEDFTGPSGSLYINGKEVNQGSSWELKTIDKHTVQSVITFPIGEELSGDLDVKLILSTPLSGDVMSRSPHWEFAFQTNGDRLKTDTIAKEIAKSIELDNGTNIVLEKYQENNVSANISYELDGQLDGQFLSIEGVDRNGNKVVFVLEGIINQTGKFVAKGDSYDFASTTNKLTLSLVLNGEALGETFVIEK